MGAYDIMLNTGSRGSSRPGMGGYKGGEDPPWGQTTPEEFLDLLWVGRHAWVEIIDRGKSLEIFVQT